MLNGISNIQDINFKGGAQNTPVVGNTALQSVPLSIPQSKEPVSPINFWFNLPAIFNKIKKITTSSIRTSLTSEMDTYKYNKVVSAFALSDKEKISPLDNKSRQQKLNALLKNGTLLNRDSNDYSTVLDSLYKTVTEKRTASLDNAKIAGQIIDTLYEPYTITQRFGDIPNIARVFIKSKDMGYIEQAVNLNKNGSGTCVAASVEYHMANKHPAEFARWAEGLTSTRQSVEKYIDLSALSKNTMDAIWLLKEFGAPVEDFSFQRAKLLLKPDDNAIVRAQIQDNYWDKGERNILDVLFQSTLMQLGSQGTYDSLTDKREPGKFSQNTEGLIEFEKTFIESIVENSERTSVVYQNLDDDQNLIGWNTSMDVIQNHITRAIDMKDDVIVGCVATAKEYDYTNENPNKIIKDDVIEGSVATAKEHDYTSENPNKIIGGHEITITDYKKDKAGNLIFVCNDTDDGKAVLCEHSAKELLPKIHHASYSAKILEDMPNNTAQVA